MFRMLVSIGLGLWIFGWAGRAAACCPQAGEVFPRSDPVDIDQFHGAFSMGNYIGRMTDNIDLWSRADRDLFARRVIEADIHMSETPGYSASITRSSGDWAKLCKHFPKLAGYSQDYDLFFLFARFLRKEYFDVVRGVEYVKDTGIRFHRVASPSNYFEEFWADETGRPEKSWKTTLKLIQEGARWEKKYPQMDYGMGMDCPLILEVKKRYPKIKLRRGPLGVPVRQLLQAMGKAKVLQSSNL